MDDSPLQRSLKRAAERLEIRVEVPFVLDLPCGRIEAAALVHDFGYESGTLLVTRPEDLGELAAKLPDFGYGFATLQGVAHPVVAWQRLLEQWGWTGAGNPPAWLRRRRTPGLRD